MTDQTAGGLLLVEDDPNDLLFIGRAFAKVGMGSRIWVARDGDEALSLLRSTPIELPAPFLIILDLKLPGKSGLETLAEIREDRKLTRVPVIVLTSSEDSEDIRQAYALGAASYLVKPVGFNALVDLAERVKQYWLALQGGEAPPEGPIEGSKPRPE